MRDSIPGLKESGDPNEPPAVYARFVTEYGGPSYWSIEMSGRAAAGRVIARVHIRARPDGFGPDDLCMYLYGPNSAKKGMAYVGNFTMLSDAIDELKRCLEFALWPT